MVSNIFPLMAMTQEPKHEYEVWYSPFFGEICEERIALTPNLRKGAAETGGGGLTAGRLPGRGAAHGDGLLPRPAESGNKPGGGGLEYLLSLLVPSACAEDPVTGAVGDKREGEEGDGERLGGVAGG